MDPMELGAINFLRFMSKKATSRSIGYFLKFTYFDFLEKGVFQICQRLLLKKIQGILGVNR
jgi:hypothetical protein